MTTLAYAYGCLEPIDWDTDCADHLYLQNKLWNRLVEIEHEHRERYRAIVGADDAIAPLAAQIEAAKADKDRLVVERKALRAKARKRVPTPDLDAQIKVLAETIRGLATQIKEARSAAKERLAPAVRALDDWRFAAVKEARNASGLWWGNYNAVCQSYETARVAAMKSGGELRFRRFTGEGRFTCQIQGGASDEAIFEGKCSLVRIEPLPAGAFTHPSRGERKRMQRSRIAVTVYTHEGVRRMLTLPIIFHRPLPDGAIVKQVVVTRRKIGTKFRWRAVFTCTTPDQEPAHHPSSRACGVNLGFRKVSGGLRVATLAMSPDKAPEYMVLPEDWLAGMDHVSQLQSQRDEHLLPMHAAAKELPIEEAPDALRERLGRIRKAPKIGCALLAALILQWRNEYPDWMPDTLATFESWRRADRRALETMANLRDALQSRRREGYRAWARDVTHRFAIVGIGKIDARKLAALDRPDGQENELHALARSNRQRASLYLLQQELAAQAAKAGTHIVTDAGPVTTTCHVCAATTTITQDIMQVCDHCHAVWDQDVNAALNAMRTAEGAPPPREGSEDERAAA